MNTIDRSFAFVSALLMLTAGGFSYAAGSNRINDARVFIRAPINCTNVSGILTQEDIAYAKYGCTKSSELRELANSGKASPESVNRLNQCFDPGTSAKKNTANTLGGATALFGWFGSVVVGAWQTWVDGRIKEHAADYSTQLTYQPLVFSGEKNLTCVLVVASQCNATEEVKCPAGTKPRLAVFASMVRGSDYLQISPIAAWLSGHGAATKFEGKKKATLAVTLTMESTWIANGVGKRAETFTQSLISTDYVTEPEEGDGKWLTMKEKDMEWSPRLPLPGISVDGQVGVKAEIAEYLDEGFGLRALKRFLADNKEKLSEAMGNAFTKAL